MENIGLQVVSSNSYGSTQERPAGDISGEYITSPNYAISNPIDLSYDIGSPTPESIDRIANPFLDKDVAKHYQQVYRNSGYDCVHLFDPEMKWTVREKENLVRKLDHRIALMCCLLYMGLQLDRGNLQQALSDDFLVDLGLSTNDYNIGNTIFLVCFIVGEIPSSLACKAIGAHYVIPFQMISWSVIAAIQCFLCGRKSFFLARAAIALLQSGLVSELVLFLSAFYTSDELPVRLSWIWITQSVVQISSSLLSVPLLRIRGFLGLEGWRWLFLVEGLITLAVGCYAVSAVVESPAHLASKGFSRREMQIATNRTLRDDPMKGNVAGAGLGDIAKVVFDMDLLPIYLIGFIAYIPVNALNDYSTLVYRQLGWSPSQVNLLVIPYYVFHIVFLLYVTKLVQIVKNKTLVCMVAPIYSVPLLAILKYKKDAMTSPWGTWFLFTAITSTPYIHAICVGWVSKNSGSVKKRSISSAVYNLSTQAGSIVAANMYHTGDGPLYSKGNAHIFAFGCALFPLLGAVKLYYTWRNKSKESQWRKMSETEKSSYIRETNDEGNKRLDFRFES